MPPDEGNHYRKFLRSNEDPATSGRVSARIQAIVISSRPTFALDIVSTQGARRKETPASEEPGSPLSGSIVGEASGPLS
jgi:hypothetical protein